MHTILLVLLDLTFREIITDVPHDGAAIVAYLFLALFVGAIVYGSRGRRSAPGGGES
jgi:hypothetical protein